MLRKKNIFRQAFESVSVGENPRFNSGYSLIQVISTVAILLIVSTTAIMGYLKFLEKSREAVCMTNQKAIVDALKDYEMENSALPAVLGQLERRHLENGYAKVMAEAGWFVKVAHLTVKASMSSEAYAQFLTYENLQEYGVGQETFRCPSDPNGGISYGLNSNVAGKTWYEIGDNIILVGDCDSGTFSSESQLRARHQSGEVAIGVTKSGEVVETKNGIPAYSASDDDDGSDGAGDEDDDNDASDPDPDPDPDSDADPDPAPDPNSDGGGDVAGDIADLASQNEGTPLGDKLEEALAKLQEADAKLDNNEKMGAMGEYEGALNALQAAVNSGLMDTDEAYELMGGIAADAREVALEAIDYAIANGGDPTDLQSAEQALLDGDTQRGAESYNDAVLAYKNVLTLSQNSML